MAGELVMASATVAGQIERQRFEGTYAEVICWAAGLRDADSVQLSRIILPDDTSALADTLRAERTIRARQFSDSVMERYSAALARK